MYATADIHVDDLQPTSDVFWTGRTLINGQGNSLMCRKKYANYGIYVDKIPVPEMNNFYAVYYLVDYASGEVFRYTGYMQEGIPNLIVKLLKYLQTNPVESYYYSV